jgi:hypothetical protein
MISMPGRVDIGEMIHQNRALLARCDNQLAEIAKAMPHAGRDRRRTLRRRARELKRLRWRSRIVGWLLHFLDTR